MYIFNNILLFYYFLFFMVFTAGSFLATVKKLKSIDSILFYCIFIFFIVFIFLRNGFGVDEPTYLEAYKKFLVNPNSFRFEYAFLILFKIYSFVGIPESQFNNATALCMLFCAAWMIQVLVQRGYRALSFIILVFTSIYVDLMFNAYRQGFSCIFLILSVYYLNQRNLYKGVFFAICSLGFHWSAGIILLIYIFSLFISHRLMFLLLVVSLVLHLASLVINIDLLYIISNLGFEKLNITVLNNAIAKYIVAGDGSFYSYTFFWKVSSLFPMIALLFFIVYNWGLLGKDPVVRLILLLSIYCFIFINMAYSFRNYYWLIPFSFLVVDKVFTNDSPRRNANCFFVYIFIILNCIIGFFSSSIIPMIYN